MSTSGDQEILALTPRPPLGWNRYDCYGCSVNQRVVRANLDADDVMFVRYERHEDET